jgi:hypothetical protein
MLLYAFGRQKPAGIGLPLGVGENACRNASMSVFLLGDFLPVFGHLPESVLRGDRATKEA